MNRTKLLMSQPKRAETVRDAIVADILSGRLRPGERVIQEQIAEVLGVSRQPVQQALLLLRNEGLLADAPGRGLMIAPLDVDRMAHLYDVRAVVEGLAFRRAAEIASERARRLCPALIANGRKAIESGSVAMLIAADVELHNFIYDLSGNPLIAQMLQLQWTYTQRVMGEMLTRDGIPESIWQQHERMVEAVMAADAEAAEALAREHIMESAKFTARQLRAAPPAAALNGHTEANGHARFALGDGGLPLAGVAPTKATGHTLAEPGPAG